jgi:hypothetical protein
MEKTTVIGEMGCRCGNDVSRQCEVDGTMCHALRGKEKKQNRL